MIVKIGTGSETSAILWYGATPITHDELMENFEATIDRCAAGETFVLIRAGEPVIVMVPYDEYLAMQEQAKGIARKE